MKFWKLFAICPFWQRTRKTASTAPRLSYGATAGAPHSAESALSHGAAPRSLQAPHLHHPTATRSRLFTPLHPYRSMMPGTHRPITPYSCLFATLHLCAPWRREHIDPRRRTCATPCCQAPRRSQHRARSALPPLGTALELPEVWKQKSDQNCNFFAIGNCRRCPNHGSSPENEAKRPPSASFPLYGRRERAANRKKIAKAPGFLFS